MATSDKSAIICIALWCMCLLVAHACDTANGVSFGYGGRTGPKHWGSLSPNFTVCSKGIYQSPINIVRECVVHDPRMEPLKRYYAPTNATMVDNVFNIAVCPELHNQMVLYVTGHKMYKYKRHYVQYNDTAGTTMVDGKTYKLKQIHWHSPSEHTINGKRFAVELHMVHYTDDGNITVVSILYRHGKTDPFLRQIKDKLVELSAEGCKAEKGDPLPVGVVNMKELMQGADRYFRYVGSLTAPPCTENVIWNILGEIREMTKEQAVALMAPLEGSYRQNSRPIQSLNGRTVQLYDMSHNQNIH